MKNVYITKSVIHGNGLFIKEDLKEGDVVGVCHAAYNNNWYVIHPYGTMYNHSSEPNCIVKTEGDINLLIAKRYIYEDEELTVDYTKQLYLEQPTGEWI